MKRNWRGILIAVVLTAACGQNGSSITPGPSPSPGNSVFTVTISPAGATPKEIVIPLGGRLTIVNRDARAHDMNSDPHPEHTDCPEINLGLLQPGVTREGQNLVAAATCGFHDHLDASNDALRGRVVVR